MRRADAVWLFLFNHIHDICSIWKKEYYTPVIFSWNSIRIWPFYSDRGVFFKFSFVFVIQFPSNQNSKLHVNPASVYRSLCAKYHSRVRFPSSWSHPVAKRVKDPCCSVHLLSKERQWVFAIWLATPTRQQGAGEKVEPGADRQLCFYNARETWRLWTETTPAVSFTGHVVTKGEQCLSTQVLKRPCGLVLL